MFEGFARVWTAVAHGAEVGSRAPFAVKVAGTPLVLFRDAAGAPAALLDRCPHRGVALSMGKLVGGGIECPFHGWRLDGGGQVCHVPWNPDARLETLRGVRIPVREVAGRIWVFTAPDEEPSSGPAEDEDLSRPGVRVSGFRAEWATHWTRAMENMLDWPHLPFVHGASIGKGMVGKAGARMDIAWDAQPWGARTHIRIDGEPEPVHLDFRWPNRMVLRIPVPGKLLRMLVSCVPIDEGRTLMLMTMARDFMTSPLFDWFFHRQNARIASEDRAIVESSFPAEVPPPGEERSVRTDAPTLHFRKRYFAELRGTSAGLLGGGPPRCAPPVSPPRPRLPLAS